MITSSDQLTRGAFIGGEWIETGESSYDSINPATGARVATLIEATDESIDQAVRSARAAFEGQWAKTGPADRQRMLLRLAQLLRDDQENLARLDSAEMGMPVTRSRRLVEASAGFLEWYASAARGIRGSTIENNRPGDLISYTVREPVGVVGAITPWNTPLPMAIWKLGPAIASGCTLVLKPAQEASLSALRLAELSMEAGIPAGVFNVVPGGGAAGAALAGHLDVDKLCFTGSVQTGQAIIRASAGNVKRLSLELGGKSPNIIFDDADLESAAAAAAVSIFGNSGQVCVAGSRLLVQRGVYNEVLERVSEHAGRLVMGDPLDERTELGPVASNSQLDRVMSYIHAGLEEGADLLLGGGTRTPGFFVEPTIFSNAAPDMTIVQEEIFGPVLTATPFDDAEEAIRIGNATRYGLSGYVWTRDLSTANAVVSGLRTGTVQVNTAGNLDPAVPVGGYGMSGYGKELGVEQIDGYLETKAVWVAR